ncbi:hypothetical protein HYALB_00010997 [Hymenoscyphus albidus]|uniref:N-acetyltransferase domain-containing protein n=1 Tax=Hymenoscyphus albidus TaxID=595503 RepID=A0A9N9LDQ3_9HELO|nr:hypothetical protein HYALB_00010997 [Hymenoscyphus albidus]
MSTSANFYTHDTDIYNDISPHFSIRSLKKPLKLRKVASDDAEALLKHSSDQRNVQYDGSVIGLDNPEAISSLLAQWSTFTEPLARFNAVVVTDNKISGTGGIGWIGTNSEGVRVGAAGIMLNSEERGKGYAYEALKITIDFGLRELALDEIHLATWDANIPMRGLMDKKFGFMGRRIEKDRFGNEWEWRIRKTEWLESVHSV